MTRNVLAPWTTAAKRMVDALGPLPPRIADAMLALPRHEFVEHAWRRDAYADRPLPLPGSEATISAPHMVAFQLEWAELTPGLNVLEIGAGSGYLASLMAALVAPHGTVDAVEFDPRLARFASENVRAHGPASPVRVHAANGVEGWPLAAPYDRVVVSCATPRIQPSWRDQLREKGTILAPVGDEWDQVLIRWRNRGAGGETDEGPRVRFVPLVMGR
ncbi:MAG: protein-L-isoaspartate O-methyltransferase [Thermoplasmata archaeon]|nr:protein-L-isoaspartate O-methyltransferase [Thermoplasmata archaeon]